MMGQIQQYRDDLAELGLNMKTPLKVRELCENSDVDIFKLFWVNRKNTDFADEFARRVKNLHLGDGVQLACLFAAASVDHEVAANTFHEAWKKYEYAG